MQEQTILQAERGVQAKTPADGDGVRLEAAAGDAKERDEALMEDAFWVSEQLRRRGLPQGISALFAGHSRETSAAAMDAVDRAIRSRVEDGVRMRIAGTAPAVGAMGGACDDTIRRAFGLRRRQGYVG